MAQRAGKIYRDAGGGYCGPKTAAQKSMRKWTKERWTTATGKKACRKVKGKIVCDRYLPKAVWDKLTPAQRKATRAKKLKSSRQFVANTPAVRHKKRGLGHTFAGLLGSK